MSSKQKVKARKCHNQGKRAKCALYEGHTGECDLKVLVRGKWFPKLKPKPPAPGKAVELSREEWWTISARLTNHDQAIYDKIGLGGKLAATRGVLPSKG